MCVVFFFNPGLFECYEIRIVLKFERSVLSVERDDYRPRTIYFRELKRAKSIRSESKILSNKHATRKRTVFVHSSEILPWDVWFFPPNSRLRTTYTTDKTKKKGKLLTKTSYGYLYENTVMST